MPERAAILAHLRRSRDGKAARRPDSNTQRRIAAGQLRLLDALIREIETGAHLEIRMPEQTHTAMPRELETCPTCSGKGRLPAGSRCLDCDETGLAPYGQALRALDETRRDRDGWRDDAKRLMAERDDLRARLAVALEGCCPDCGGSGIGSDACDGPEHHTPPCPSCGGSGLTPDARRMAAQVSDLQAAIERVRPAALESVPDLAPQPPPTPGEADDLGFTATPARYAAHGRETIDRMRDLARATFADPGEADAAFAFFCRASALKYDDRAGLKGPAGPDRKKAAWYRQMADHVDGFAADPRDGRPDFAPYAEPLVEPVALGDVWEVTPRTFGRSRHMLCAAGDPESVILMLEVSPGADASGRVDWFCSPPGREFQESYFDRGTIMAQPGTLDAAIEEGCRLARASYDRWSQAQMARIGGAAPYG